MAWRIAAAGVFFALGRVTCLPSPGWRDSQKSVPLIAAFAGCFGCVFRCSLSPFTAPARLRCPLSANSSRYASHALATAGTDRRPSCLLRFLPRELQRVRRAFFLRIISIRRVRITPSSGIQIPAECLCRFPLARHRVVLHTADARCVGRVFCCIRPANL